MTENLHQLSATKLMEGYKKKEFLPSEVVSSYIQQVEKHNPNINAYITTNLEQAQQQAKISDENIQQDNIRPMEAIPMGIKDLFMTKNIRTTSASRMLDNFIPQYESTVTQKLLDAGTINLGKLNMDEFAMGSTNLSSYYGKVINPIIASDDDNQRVPGGSSGGSAAAVGGHLCCVATGSDTGGSIRQPAAFTATVGVKPTYGLCSRYGMISFSSSLDQAGVISKNLDDAALTLTQMTGFDNKDSTSLKVDIPDYTKSLGKSIKDKKIGVMQQLKNHEAINPDILNCWNNAENILKEQGCKIVDIELSSLKYASQVYYIISSAEAVSNLARFDGVKYGFRADDITSYQDMIVKTRTQGFGSEVKKRLIVGSYVLLKENFTQYYLQAMKVRRKIINEFQNIFKNLDAILLPTTVNQPYSISQKEKFTETVLNDMFTVPVSLAGLPAVSLPAGLNKKNLPLAMQIITDKLQEDNMFAIAHVLEKNLQFDNQKMKKITRNTT